LSANILHAWESTLTPFPTRLWLCFRTGTTIGAEAGCSVLARVSAARPRLRSESQNPHSLAYRAKAGTPSDFLPRLSWERRETSPFRVERFNLLIDGIFLVLHGGGRGAARSPCDC
jgi:hypothetical protein